MLQSRVYRCTGNADLAVLRNATCDIVRRLRRPCPLSSPPANSASHQASISFANIDAGLGAETGIVTAVTRPKLGAHKGCSDEQATLIPHSGFAL